MLDAVLLPMRIKAVLVLAVAALFVPYTAVPDDETRASLGRAVSQTAADVGAEGTGASTRSRSAQGENVIYTIQPDLHELAKKLLREANAPHVAAVVMEPATGKILAMAEKSESLPHAVLHARYPAASLFKIVTSAAALETNTIEPLTTVYYRGGTYTLDRSNYTVDPKRDRNSMSLADALGKSCNPVFARVALQHLMPSRLANYANRFGFNTDLKFDIPLRASAANIPNDSYEFSRTAAGFGEVTISPIHAAALISAVANRGLLPQPHVVDKIVRQDGSVRFEARTQYLSKAILPETAEKLLRMLEYTTISGTTRKEFFPGKRAALPGVRVAAKTGTLRGQDPLGLTRWFVAAAPIENPRVAVAVVAINPVNGAGKPAHIGRMLIQKYLNVPEVPGLHRAAARIPAQPKYRSVAAKKTAVQTTAPAKKKTAHSKTRSKTKVSRS